MRLLLTSAGITNDSIAKAVLELVGQPAEKVRAVFVPTAANVEVGDKGWLRASSSRRSSSWTASFSRT